MKGNKKHASMHAHTHVCTIAGNAGLPPTFLRSPYLSSISLEASHGQAHHSLFMHRILLGLEASCASGWMRGQLVQVNRNGKLMPLGAVLTQRVRGVTGHIPWSPRPSEA